VIRALLAAALGALVVLAPAAAQDRLADLVEAGERDAALALVADGADVRAAQSDGTTALHWAAYHGEVELAAALLAAGAEPNVINAYGSTPLAEAIRVIDTDLVAVLLEGGADPNAANADGETALMTAVRTGEAGLVKSLLDHGADANAREAWRDQTALMWAADDGDVEIVRLLLAAGADPNVRAASHDWERQVTSEPRAQYRGTGGLTPLLYAARSRCVACVAALLDAGAEIDAPNPDGVTPLMTAIDNGGFDAAKLLLDRGANPHVWDWWGRTALYVAADASGDSKGGTGIVGGIGRVPIQGVDQENTALDIARALLEAGVDPNTQLTLHRPDRSSGGRFADDGMRTGCTPLLRAAISNDIALARLLLDHGALVDVSNVMGVTPLMAAAGMTVSIREFNGGHRSGGEGVEANAIALIDLLLEHGADINARVTDTSSWSARIGRPSTMTDRQGETAIYAAATWGWSAVVQHLIDNGAELDIADAKGKTPLDAARGAAGGAAGGGRPSNFNEETAAVIEAAMGPIEG
jgi:ankyrin repeat protein